jgi:hypothetical protein
MYPKVQSKLQGSDVYWALDLHSYGRDLLTGRGKVVRSCFGRLLLIARKARLLSPKSTLETHSAESRIVDTNYHHRKESKRKIPIHSLARANLEHHVHERSQKRNDNQCSNFKKTEHQQFRRMLRGNCVIIHLDHLAKLATTHTQN